MAERKSQVVSLTILRDYNILWHYTEQEGREMNTISQSRHLSESEWEGLSQELSALFKEKNIPQWIMEELEEQLCIE
jgi:hypothetical protein